MWLLISLCVHVVRAAETRADSRGITQAIYTDNAGNSPSGCTEKLGGLQVRNIDILILSLTMFHSFRLTVTLTKQLHPLLQAEAQYGLDPGWCRAVSSGLWTAGSREREIMCWKHPLQDRWRSVRITHKTLIKQNNMLFIWPLILSWPLNCL